MAEIKLVATARTEFGKGAARRLRRADQIPAVLYGHGSDPLHVALPGHQTMLAVKQANALFSVELDGKTTLAITKDVQRDVVKNTIEHVDLLIVTRGEKVTDAYGRKLKLWRLPPDLLSLTDPRAVQLEKRSDATAPVRRDPNLLVEAILGTVGASPSRDESNPVMPS
jgi:ribosomal protein L25 (general stress protein Ctc)